MGNRDKEYTKARFKDWLPYILIIIGVILIRTFIISPARVDGDSMKDTLSNGDIVFVNKMNLNEEGIIRFDIVVLKYESELLVKRVIAVPNETIEYKENILYINGHVVTPPMNFEYTEDFEGSTGNNEYFVLGDNRDDSKDSRYFGAVKLNKIKGTVVYRFFPFDEMGKIE